MADLVEKELSYKIVGALFEVYNDLGGGYQEKYYQKALSQEFQKKGMMFAEQIATPLSYKGNPIGRYFLDFVVEKRVVVEIKATSKFYARDIKQVLAYLKISGLPLGILANYSRSGLSLKRILAGR